jgi:hypothetical protein
MARAATLILGLGLLVPACSSPTPQPSPTNEVSTFPPRAELRMAFEKLGVRFAQGTQQGHPYLASANSNYSASDRAFLGVEIVGDPVTQVIVNLNAFTADSAGRFSGSALIDVLDGFDPGVKRWFLAQTSDPRHEGLESEIGLNGLIAQIPPTHVPGAALVIESLPSPTPSP